MSVECFVRAKSMQHGKIYTNQMRDGELQKDKDGKVFWKKRDGTIQQVRMSPETLVIELRSIENGSQTTNGVPSSSESHSSL